MHQDPLDPVGDRSVLRGFALRRRVRVRGSLSDGERRLNEVLIGATLPQFEGDRDRLLQAARSADDAGLDSLWLFDHLWPLSGGKGRPIFESWTTVAWLIAMTERVRVGTLVTRSSLRDPALLAKMAATTATIAPGRLIVAMGSGDEMSRAENEAFGIRYYEADERIEQFEATVRVFHEFLHSDRVTVHSGPVQVEALEPSPIPPVAPKLWLGGRSDDVLAAAGRYADGWNGWGGSAERFAADAQQVLGYAAEHGREVELSWGGIAVLREDDEAARGALGDRDGGDRIVGGPESAARKLAGYVDAGARHLVLTPAGSSAGPDFYELVARIRGLLS